ncbi:MAG: hypothetical protein BGO11_04385 [Solirubrobacterales bacterium 70-9]|nr:MAG: hypothetical protein BGO11_04385 [Solirubrobacterales bacterium 70-9]
MSLKVREAAVELFSRQGYDGTSMRDIAKRSNISVANLYNYTDSKETLFWTLMKAAVEDLMHEQREALSHETCSAARFVVFAYTHAKHHTTHAREVVRLGNTPMESLSPDRADKVRAVRDEYEGMFRAVIGEGLKDDFLKTDHYVLANRAILQMGVGISLWFHPEEVLTSESVANVYAAFAMAIVGYDSDAHDRTCAAGTECVAATTWMKWAPGR